MIDYLEVSSEKNRDNRFTKDDVLSVSGEYGIVNQIEFQGRSFAGASVSNYGVVETLSISKTWDYKGKGGFLPTKNKSSVRKIQIDWQIVVKFSELVKGLPEDEPIFVGEEKIYNSTVNDALTRHCKACGISEISIHGLRHTHASLLLFAGVSIASVARRLGHASMTTTQKTYLHIIQELENKDVDLVMRTLSGL